MGAPLAQCEAMKRARRIALSLSLGPSSLTAIPRRYILIDTRAIAVLSCMAEEKKGRSGQDISFPGPSIIFLASLLSLTFDIEPPPSGSI